MSSLAVLPHCGFVIFVVEETHVFLSASIHISRGLPFILSMTLETLDLVRHVAALAVSTGISHARKAVRSTTLSTWPWIGPLQ